MSAIKHYTDGTTIVEALYFNVMSLSDEKTLLAWANNAVPYFIEDEDGIYLRGMTIPMPEGEGLTVYPYDFVIKHKDGRMETMGAGDFYDAYEEIVPLTGKNNPRDVLDGIRGRMDRGEVRAADLRFAVSALNVTILAVEELRAELVAHRDYGHGEHREEARLESALDTLESALFKTKPPRVK